jgi:general secretion pathway protein H
LIGEQRIVLRLADQRLTLATDGIGPFVVADDHDVAP